MAGMHKNRAVMIEHAMIFGNGKSLYVDAPGRAFSERVLAAELMSFDDILAHNPPSTDLTVTPLIYKYNLITGAWPYNRSLIFRGTYLAI
jgi:hypothetical protein